MANANPFETTFGPAVPDTSAKPESDALDWDAAITDESDEYVVLRKGVYPFTVTSFDRKQYTPKPGGKMPPCNQAVLHLLITAPDGRKATAVTNLFLIKAQSWKIAAFFRSIGLMKRGETLVMDWSKVPGASGLAEIEPRNYNGREYNDVVAFKDPAR